jgi:hypothetical protein
VGRPCERDMARRCLRGEWAWGGDGHVEEDSIGPSPGEGEGLSRAPDDVE